MNFGNKKEVETLVEDLRRGYLKDPRVINAILKVARERFIPKDQQHYAYLDRPIPIGHGQTISAPHMVAMMSELLDVRTGQKILEIGAGSGYQAAILAELVGDGQVYTIERIPELAIRARKNLQNAGYKNVEVIVGDGTEGYEKEGPYDRIIVTAASPKVPNALLDQLKDKGRLLIPVGSRMLQELKLIEKRGKNISERGYGACVFVPLVGKEGW